MIIITASLALFLSIRDGIIDPQSRDKFYLLNFIPQLSWYWWVIIALFLLLVLMMEGAYRISESKRLDLKRRYKTRLQEVQEKSHSISIGIAAKQLLEATSIGKGLPQIQSQPMKPEIILKIKEAFVVPLDKPRSANCFLRISLNNATDISCAIPDDYSLTLTILGKNYETKSLLKLDNYYLSIYREIDKYDDEGNEYEAEEEIGREDLTDIQESANKLRKRNRVQGWLGFFISDLPEWDYEVIELGQHIEYDSEGEERYVCERVEIPLTHRVKTLTLKVIDDYNQPFSDEITESFTKYGRRILRRQKR
jgi:hypothetical protein